MKDLYSKLTLKKIFFISLSVILLVSFGLFSLKKSGVSSASAQIVNGNGTPPELIVYGPKIFERGYSKPNYYIDKFIVKHSLTNDFILKIKNGNEDGEYKISSAIIKLNGEKIVRTNELNQKIYQINKPIVLEEEDILEIELRSKPKGFIEITIEVDPTEVLAQLYQFLINEFGTEPVNIDPNLGLRIGEIPQDLFEALQNLVPQNSFVYLKLTGDFPFLHLVGYSKENFLAKEGLNVLLDELSTRGIIVDELRSALNGFFFGLFFGSQIHEEGVESGGYIINLPDAQALASLPDMTWLGQDILAHLDIKIVHIILMKTEIETLLSGLSSSSNFFEDDGSLKESASTAIHELLHAMFYLTSCFTGNLSDEEGVAGSFEVVIKAKVLGTRDIPKEEEIIARGGGDCLDLLGLLPPASPLSCDPTFRTRVVNQGTFFTAHGGTGNYMWSITGADPENCEGVPGDGGSNINVRCSTAGRRDINLNDGVNPTEICTLNVVNPGGGEF